MIKGKVLEPKSFISTPNVNYREIKSLNKSMIALFDSDPVKFFEEFKLGKPRKEKESLAIVLGNIVDFYLLDCLGNEDLFDNRFDEKFSLLDGTKGTGQVFTLADEMFKISMADTDPETNECKTDFNTRFEKACDEVRAQSLYKKKDNAYMLKDFYDNGYNYYDAKINNIGKTVIDTGTLDKGKKIAKQLRHDNFTKDLFTDDDSMQNLMKFPIEWKYETKSGKLIDCKSELDLLKVDHHTKTIYLKDIKTTYDNEGFEYTYLKHSYYLQAAFYYLAVKFWAVDELQDYKIEPMEFIVGDTSANDRRPLRYSTNQTDLEAGLNGFTLSGKRYRGIHELIEEISWAEDNNIWNISREAFNNNGLMKINLIYG